MTPSDSQYKLCITTIDNIESAKKLAKVLLQQKLVACVNISNKMTSLYVWQEDLVEEAEFVLLMKTSASKIVELQAAILSLHAYDVPEFIVLSIETGAPDYLNWINSALS